MMSPLRAKTFRRMWSASLFSNLGQLIQGVGATWAMAEMKAGADLVALVQTALMAPVMLFALGAGAIADTYDRRKVGLAALLVAFAGGAGLTAVAWADLLTPGLILLFTFFIGSGVAFFAPAWQASANELVAPQDVPAAISLNSISFNVARSFGPAIGGLVISVAGVVAAFAINAAFFLPMMLVFLLWRRTEEPARFPPEQLYRAIISGLRYLGNSLALRIVLLRALVMGVLGSILSSMMPLIARDQLGGDARIYGLLLGAYGVGAVAGAMNIARFRRITGDETIVAASSAAMGLAAIGIAFAPSLWAALPLLFLAGGGLMIVMTILNVAIQVMAPRWVGGRTLAAFQAATAGGIAAGSWMWGTIAATSGLATAILAAGGLLVASALIGLRLRLPRTHDMQSQAGQPAADPEVVLGLTGRSGPIVIDVHYRVPSHRARSFYLLMQDVQLSRQRNGAYGWSISRDVADPDLWTERYYCPTWLDYLRQRDRPTQAERDLHDLAFAFHVGDEPPVIRRMLERPYGSVRRGEHVRDRATDAVLPVSPGG